MPLLTHHPISLILPDCFIAYKFICLVTVGTRAPPQSPHKVSS